MDIFFSIRLRALLILSCLVIAHHAAAEVLTLDASAIPAAASASDLHLGMAVSPDGHIITVDRRGLLLDGQPWLPISGEFQFSRCPESEWRDELLKMKAGGVSIVQTYIFWIHHEEVEGVWDWNGQRGLTQNIL